MVKGLQARNVGEFLLEQARTSALWQLASTSAIRDWTLAYDSNIESARAASSSTVSPFWFTSWALILDGILDRN